MRLRGVLALVVCLPAPVAAMSLTIEVWPSRDPTRTIYCAMTLTGGRFSTVEVIGPGPPGRRPQQWYSTEAEVTALTAAIQSLIGGALAGQDILTSRTPPPPYLSATWIANVDNVTVSGLYIAPGTTLPAALLQAVLTVLPGGPCARHLGP